VPAFAALLGYLMFYGRISDVYMGVITLTVTLILFKFVNSTAGPEFHIGVGAARRLQRHPGIPLAQLPFKDAQIDLEGHVLSVAGLLISRSISATRLLVAQRASAASSSASARTSGARELLGYDRAAYKLATVHHRRRDRRARRLPVRQLGLFVSPTIFGLAQSAQIIIWVIVGGRGTLIGPVLGCVLIQWLTPQLGANRHRVWASYC
jgi:ABC-type branched-subunit amino acid transport system permease subunit